jgi:hypothetical protein
MKPDLSNINPERLPPQQYIANFCTAYTVIDVKNELLQWLLYTIKAGGEAGVHVQSQEFSTFYDDLNKLITAMYRVHDRNGSDPTLPFI